MTLAIGISSPEVLLVGADRRLTFDARCEDTATKIFSLETSDGQALLGYAGLGMTGSGTEISQWLTKLLRSQQNSLEGALGKIADALPRQFPQHLASLPRGAPREHAFIAPAFVGGQPSLYTIDIDINRNPSVTYESHVGRPLGAASSPFRIVLAGSGVPSLLKIDGWSRSLLRYLKAHATRGASIELLADELARLIYLVSRGTRSVGPSSVVSWVFNKLGPREGGGDNMAYEGRERRGRVPVPTVAGYFDVNQLLGATLPLAHRTLDAALKGLPNPVTNLEHKAAIDALDWDAKENLE